jgi:hypothetical protein
MALYSNELSLVCSRDGVELAVLHLSLFVVEVVGHSVDALRIADKYDSVCQLFGFQVQMKARTVGIDNQF